MIRSICRYLCPIVLILVCINARANYNWTAYNDCVYEVGTDYIAANATTYSVSGSTSGELLDLTNGNGTGVIVTITQSGGVTKKTGSSSGGVDASVGADAYDLFRGLADMTGVLLYGSTGWQVAVRFTNLEPDKKYTFAASANRNRSDYADRWTRYTISDADEYVYAGSGGALKNSEDSVSFCTGYNTSNGYLARWTGVSAGADGDYEITAQAHGVPYNEAKAYSFDVFMLAEEVSGPPVSPYMQGDINQDKQVDIDDLLLFSEQWLNAEGC